MKGKKILFMSDTHCGHFSGLTPPEWWMNPERSNKLGMHIREIQETQYGFWKDSVKDKKYDLCIFNADAIDGKQKKSGGRGLITTSLKEQCEMAVRILEDVNAPLILMTIGSGYHVGRLELYEKNIAEQDSRVKIKNVIQKLEVNGLRFKGRHKIGRSSTPVGGDIMLRKKWVDDLLWAQVNDSHPADIFFYSHVHYQRTLRQPEFIVFTTPSLQGFSEFGQLEASGYVHFGTIDMQVPASGKLEEVTITPHVMKLKAVDFEEGVKI